MKKVIYCLLIATCVCGSLLAKGHKKKRRKKSITSEHHIRGHEDHEMHLFKEFGIYACLIGDTSNPETKEYHISDMQKIEDMLRHIASEAHVPLHLTKLEGASANFDAIKKEAIRARKRKFRHFQFLYYTGEECKASHGKDTSLVLHLAQKGSKGTKGITQQALEAFFGTHIGSFFTLSFADCYKSIKTIEGSFLPYEVVSVGENKIKNLCMRPQLLLPIASKKKYKKAFGFADETTKGGMSTQALCHAVFASSCSTWKELVRGMKKELNVHGQEMYSDLSYYKAEDFPLLVK